MTYNSENSIQRSIREAKKITKDIIVVDSFSTDNTIKICKKFKCKLFQRKFINYSNQRNWIIDKINSKYEWQLHLDADEIIDKKLIKSINTILHNEKKNNCFLIKKKYYFLNKLLNYPGLNQWHLRLFRSKTSKCENRSYDQHFITRHKIQYIQSGSIHDLEKISLTRWKEKHLIWAKMEANEIYKQKNKNNTKFFAKNDLRLKTRRYKNLYYNLPYLIRPFLYFLYRYFYKGSFKDGKTGFMFSYYQSLWFRIHVDLYILKNKIKF